MIGIENWPWTFRTEKSYVLSPHVTGECLITLDEQSVKALRDLLMNWLG